MPGERRRTANLLEPWAGLAPEHGAGDITGTDAGPSVSLHVASPGGGESDGREPYVVRHVRKPPVSLHSALAGGGFEDGTVCRPGAGVRDVSPDDGLAPRRVARRRRRRRAGALRRASRPQTAGRARPFYWNHGRVGRPGGREGDERRTQHPAPVLPRITRRRLRTRVVCCPRVGIGILATVLRRQYGRARVSSVSPGGASQNSGGLPPSVGLLRATRRRRLGRRGGFAVDRDRLHQFRARAVRVEQIRLALAIDAGLALEGRGYCLR